jgi:hypothetical protein
MNGLWSQSSTSASRAGSRLQQIYNQKLENAIVFRKEREPNQELKTPCLEYTEAKIDYVADSNGKRVEWTREQEDIKGFMDKSSRLGSAKVSGYLSPSIPEYHPLEKVAVPVKRKKKRLSRFDLTKVSNLSITELDQSSSYNSIELLDSRDNSKELETEKTAANFIYRNSKGLKRPTTGMKPKPPVTITRHKSAPPRRRMAEHGKIYISPLAVFDPQLDPQGTIG